MAERRRLFAEMEKVFRKVDEGVELFEETITKMNEANSENQRDKSQEDLKKEIKKLQRLRDQIKGWQNSNDVKDKDKLNNYRKTIEQRMEQFKDIERENKTKSYSEKGLSAEEKRDPKEKEKADAIDYLQGTLTKLSEHIDVYEAEIENLSATSGKKKKIDKDRQRRIEDFNTRLLKHKQHMQKLEIAMRLVNNDTIDSSAIDTHFRESLNHYAGEVMADMDDDDYLWVYDDLNLGDTAQITQQLGNVTNIGTLEGAPDNASDSSSQAPSPTSSPPPPKESSKEPDEPIVPAAAAVSATPSGAAAPSSAGSASSGKQRHTSGGCKLSAPSANLAGHKSTPNTPLKLTSQLSSDGTTGGGAATSLASPPPPAPSVPYNIAAGAAGRTPTIITKQHSVGPSLPAAVATGGLLGRLSAPQEHQHNAHPTPDQPVASVSIEHSLSAGSTGSSRSATAAAAGALSQLRITAPAPLTIQASAISPPQQQPPSHSSALAALASASPQDRSVSRDSDGIANDEGTGGRSSASTAAAVASLKSMAEQAVSDGDRAAAAAALAAVSSNLFGAPVQQQPQKPLEAHIPPALGASPLGKVPLDDVQRQHLAYLDAALLHMPLPMDSQRTSAHMPRMPLNTPAYYPQAPPPSADSFSYFCNLQLETLFFIFYYMEGTRAQYMAARALKFRSWRFHKKLMMWFQRYQDPTIIKDDYEQGTYVFFDFETWKQRRRENFTFEYQYLEDREL